MKKQVAGEDGTFVRRLLDRTIVRAIHYVMGQTQHYHVLHELQRRTAADQADYVLQHMKTALNFESRPRLWDHALSKVTVDGMYLEFGVWNGGSINYIARKASALRGKRTSVYGFDSFEGLQEDWPGSDQGKGGFDRGGVLPPVDDNVTLIKGWFDQTLAPFVQQHPGPVAFLHVDCDTYEATKTIFTLLRDRIVPGTVMVMDDYFGHHGWREAEHKAWMEFVQSASVRFEYLAFGIWPVAVKVHDIAPAPTPPPAKG